MFVFVVVVLVGIEGEVVVSMFYGMVDECVIVDLFFVYCVEIEYVVIC